MFSIFSAIATTTSFSGVTILWKRLRDKNVSPLAILGLAAICIPLWIIVGIVLYSYGYIPVFNNSYLLILAVWVIGCFFINWTGTYLYKYRTLTELRTYQTSVAILVAIVVDVVFFRSSTSVWSVIATIILFISGLILSGNVSHNVLRGSLSLSKVVLPILTFNAFLQVLNIAAYKIAIEHQVHPLYQAVIGQTFLYFLFFLTGFRGIRSGISDKKISYKEICAIAILLFVGTIFEIYMIKSFSVSLTIVLSVIPITIYSLYDFKQKNIKISKQSILALTLIIIGLCLSEI